MSAPERAGLRSGEVAEQAGVNIQTLRYYERRGLLAEPHRSSGGHRLYPPDTVGLLHVIKTAQRLGFTLDEVAELLDTGRRRHPAPDLRERAIDKIAEIDRRIADLSTIRATLAEVVEARCDSLTDCTCADCPIPFPTIGAASGGPAGADPFRRRPVRSATRRRRAAG
jgi:DNA-binding transcriptional MerR regulator